MIKTESQFLSHLVSETKCENVAVDKSNTVHKIYDHRFNTVDECNRRKHDRYPDLLGAEIVLKEQRLSAGELPLPGRSACCVEFWPFYLRS